MGCGCENANNTMMESVNNYAAGATVPMGNCDILKENLIMWQTVLLCTKTSNKLTEVSLTEFTVNQFLGVIQSAINYPDNYCLYKPQLEYIQNSIIPNIVSNVPECFNQSPIIT